MREVLFRGKRKDNSEWVEGLLWKKKYNDGNRIFISCFPDEDDNEEVFIVYPETVGQYTGLTDENCEKIFEGDILQQYNMLYVVSYQEGTFVAYETPYNEGAIIPRYDWRFAKVIGNIYDNPELLEVDSRMEVKYADDHCSNGEARTDNEL